VNTKQTMPLLKAPGRWTMDDTTRLVFVILLAGAIWGFLVLTGHRWLIYPDAMEYAQTARNMSEGRGAVTESLWLLRTAYSVEIPPPDVRRPLLWPAVISLFFRITGPADWAAIVASGFLGWVASGMFFLLARKVLPSMEAFLCSLVFVFQPEIILMNQSGLSEPLFTFLLLLIAFLWIRSRGNLDYFLLGLAAGLTQWVRLNGFLIIIPLLVYEIYRRKKLKDPQIGLLLLGFILVLFPILIRNQVLLGEFSILNLARYSVVGEIPPYPDHGAERALEKISVLGTFLSHPVAVLAKYMRGFSENFTVLFRIVNPLLWGLWLVPLWGGKSLSRQVVLLSRFGFFLLLLYLLSFSIGEFEGQRFYIPVAPFVVMGGFAGWLWILYHLKNSGGSEALSAPEQEEKGVFSVHRLRGKTVVFLILLVLPGLLHLRQSALSPPNAGFRHQLYQLLAEYTEADAVIGSDTPWATGWYSRRLSIWLPESPVFLNAVNERLELDYIVLTASVTGPEWNTTPWIYIYGGSLGLPGYEKVYPPEGRAPVVIYKKTEPLE
jgi:hypothetical protein